MSEEQNTQGSVVGPTGVSNPASEGFTGNKTIPSGSRIIDISNEDIVSDREDGPKFNPFEQQYTQKETPPPVDNPLAPLLEQAEVFCNEIIHNQDRDPLDKSILVEWVRRAKELHINIKRAQYGSY